MSDESKFSLTIKSDTSYESAMLTVRGDTEEEFTENISSVSKKLLGKVVDLNLLFHGVQNAAAGLGGGEKKPKKDKGQPEQEQEAPAADNGGELRTCQHGKRNFREGKGRTGPWAAYFCPERDKRNQCDPDWVAQD